MGVVVYIPLKPLSLILAKWQVIHVRGSIVYFRDVHEAASIQFQMHVSHACSSEKFLSRASVPARLFERGAAPCPIFERPARYLGVLLRPAQIFSPVYTSHWFLDSKRPCGFEERIVDWYRVCDVRFCANVIRGLTT